MNWSTANAREINQAGLFANGQAVPLLGVEVRAEVVAGHARSVVRQRYKNEEARPIEAVYTFPLPARGAVTGFAMSVDGRRLVGEVHEREEAFRRYDDAVSAGHGSALLEQERPNVFTANVGNLLPGEETVIEIEYVEPIHGDEGAIRWMLPTLVAPRYMPGNPAGDRTAHGTADPTTRVPDADRISPPQGVVGYGLSLELVFDLGVDIDVESPSHQIRIDKTGGRTRVSLAQREVALDRDVVVTAYPVKGAFAAAPLTSVVAHRAPAGDAASVGTFAVSLVPDLADGLKKRGGKSEVVFVIDRSGSMEGSAIAEAKTALRLCLRQLREGDRFAIIAFDDRIEEFSPSPTSFTPATLRSADTWIDSIGARGGTEMLAPLLRATAVAPNGVIVLLTDGQVGNEAEIEKEVLGRRGAARIYSFGIGMNVSDALLIGLADKTGGAVEMIHPGERVDDKVVAQFARATAPRVTELAIAFRGVDVGEIAPAAPIALVDGEPFTIFGTYETPGVGAVELRGVYEGEKFFLEVPLDLPAQEDRPSVTKLWAQARIRDLEHAVLDGRRAESMKARIIELAKAHGVSSKYTSFVVVEKRTGDRRVNEQAETRVVPVSAPADWGRATRALSQAARSRSYGAPAGSGAAPPAAVRRSTLAGSVSSLHSPAPARPMSAISAPRAAMPAPLAARAMSVGAGAPSSVPPSPAQMMPPPGMMSGSPGFAKGGAGDGFAPSDPVTQLLERQSASGLWEEAGRDPIEVTVEALLVLVRLGVSSSHPVHGAQTKKAVDALLEALAANGAKVDPKLAELALASLWLLSTGRRTRVAIKDAATSRGGLDALAALLDRDDEVRAHVERISPST